jgi:hypothetical protein
MSCKQIRSISTIGCFVWHKLGIVLIDAAQRVRAVRPAGSTGEAVSMRRDQVQFNKDSLSSDVVRVLVSGTVTCTYGSKIKIFGGAIWVRFDKGVDRLIFGAHKGTKEGRVR